MTSIKAKALKYWQDHNCARSTAGGILSHYKHPAEETMVHAFTTYGGGLSEGSACGAVLGTLAGMSIIANKFKLSDEETRELSKEYRAWFKQNFGDLHCNYLTQSYRTGDGSFDEEKQDERKYKCTMLVSHSVIKAEELLENAKNKI